MLQNMCKVNCMKYLPRQVDGWWLCVCVSVSLLTVDDTARLNDTDVIYDTVLA